MRLVEDERMGLVRARWVEVVAAFDEPGGVAGAGGVDPDGRSVRIFMSIFSARSGASLAVIPVLLYRWTPDEGERFMSADSLADA